MGKLNIFTLRLASLLVFHAAGAGLASPAVLVTRPVSRVAVEWLPIDNQTVYRLGEGESRSLELNTTSISQSVVFFSISPCSRDFHWALYHGKSTSSSGHLMLRKEHNSSEDLSTFSLNISQQDKYVLVLSSSQGGAAVVSVRGEATRQVRMRLRVRSRRRLAANWEPSPIDPQATTYCVVASHLKNYTSLCAAQHELKLKRMENKSNRLSQESDRLKERINDTFPQFSLEVDNKINVDEGTFNIFEGKMNNVFRRKKFGRSTKVTDEDPVIACVGSRTHHLIENLDPSVTYFVSVFGVANDRRSGSLLASGSVRPRTSTAKRLRENLPSKVDIRGRNVFYFKATVGSGGGLWLTVSSCGGAVDVEVLVRGKRLHMVRNIDPHAKFFVSTPIPTSSVQETSDEGSIQFDSSSEEARVRYVIKVMPSRRDRDNSVAIEVTASTTRWGVSAPELSEDGSTVRELRPRRSCKSVDVAFIPATHNATDVIRYCIIAREIVNGGSYSCWLAKKSTLKGQCIDNVTKSARVIMHKIVGLKPGRKYAVQVVAVNKGNSVPYNILYVDTNASCKEDK